MISLKSILILLFVIFIIHVLATFNYWYWVYSWLDIVMHFFSGLCAAMFFVWLNFKFKILNYSFLNNQCSSGSVCGLFNSLIFLLIALSFVALIGVLWEFYEFLYDVFISKRGYSGFAQLGAADTMADLFFDLLGGLIFLIIYKINLYLRFKKIL